MENQTNIFKTTDIKTSAYLLAKGFLIVKVLRNDPHKITFCFTDKERIKNLLNDYWSSKGLINPHILFDKLDFLKDLIHRDYEI